jgi:tRNA pseudouridine38-40 synthase
MRIALCLEYDGQDYCGWQSQPAGCGIQDALERALAVLALHKVRVITAGRTDTGVHALSQVVHFDTETIRPEESWVRGVNAHLHRTLRVQWAKNVDPRFHARFDAQARSYQYLLVNQATAPSILAGKAGWFHLPLNVSHMQEAASYLLGEHDFSAFRAADCQAKSPIKHLYQADIQTIDKYLIFSFSGNAFLHHQVRNMLGALIYIGKGKYPPSHIKTLLDAQDRTMSPPTFSPDGLYLTGVKYEAMWGLPETHRQLKIII